MSIKPLDNRVVVQYVKKDEGEEKTKGGIVLPDTAKKDEKPQQAEIVAVGKNIAPEDGEAEIAVGDTVIFDKYAGTKVEIDSEEYIILSIDDVLAVIE
ncbi:co-chaperone GroES [Halanaerobium congolense]|jgi:chaperonin GroES|uniref:Co-chaperonin GroES n=1 Tax=Halanaerobium congolense TaxID=54121 RepID=A0A1G6PYP9_9FIRM|nr:co-chaperone GroES [Halanaerobium congolense]KXS49611.1 MAG: chaperonin GroES [Halanaerobium sp. T82-1]OEG63349.1 MAG: co-chaperone GroES [Halanaerobium sp. MDAL1]PUU92532.1 MAG: chaperonin GroES [Halanaerobium sp.]PTX15488.1 chaperonin GroES [Halanaerobium congolense]PXV68292.1 chaperonin GroES [Halanaerobium congolense]